MSRSRMDSDLRRLLSKCEAMLDPSQPEYRPDIQMQWRFGKYVETLKRQLLELKDSGESPEKISDYEHRISLLEHPEEIKDDHCQKITEDREYVQDHRTQEFIDARRELLDEGHHVRKRFQAEAESTGDLDQAIKHNERKQERLTEDMLLLVRNLKENAETAGRFVKQDTEVLRKATDVTESNYGKLKAQTDRLSVHTKKSCNWWVWIMIPAVCLTFLWMVVFMRMFGKS